MNSQALAPHVHLDDTIGSFFVGLLVSMALWGVSSRQVWHYWMSFRTDGRLVRMLVIVLWTLDSLHMLLISHAAYTYLITNYANPGYLNVPTWSLVAQTPVQATLAFAVQLFFTYKFWKLSDGRRRIVTALLVVMATATYATILALSIVAAIAPPNLIIIAERMRVLEPLGSALACLTDVLITASMTVVLGGQKMFIDAECVESDAMLAENLRMDYAAMKLVLWTLRTGLLTTICSLLILFTYYANQQSLVWQAFFFIIGRLYFNSFMASLNLRRCIRRKLSTPAGDLLPPEEGKVIA